MPNISNAILALIALTIFSRILKKEDYGTIALAQAYAIFANGLVNFGMSAAYDRNYFQYSSNKRRQNRLLTSIILFVIANFMLICLLTFLFKKNLSNIILGDIIYGNLLFWAFCGQFFFTINNYYLAYFKNSENAKYYTFITVILSLINFVFALIFIAKMKVGVIGIVYAQFFSGFLIFSILSIKFINIERPLFDRKIFIDSLKIGYPLTPRVFLGVINTQFDKYMIGLMSSLGGVGIYSVGQKVSSLIFTFMTSIQNVFSPEIYKRMFNSKENGKETIGEYLTPFAYIIVFLTLFISLFAEEIIYILTPKSYHGATDIVIVLSLFYGLLFFGKVNGNQLIYQKKTWVSSILSILNTGLNICLNIAFIIKWGAIGAAWATLSACTISCDINWFYWFRLKIKIWL